MNNPLKYIDPSGHVNVCGVNGDDCENDRDAMIEIYYASEAETPLVYPIVVGNEIVGREYYMPTGTAQSSVREDSAQYTVGRVLAGVGIATDVGEVILSLYPGASVLPGYGDGLLTYFAGTLTGDNYGLAQAPEGLPSDTISFNHDTVVNVTEAFIPPAVAKLLGVSAVVSIASPIPVDDLAVGGMALAGYQVVDAVTSTASALYDYGRFTGDLQNPFTVGYSSNAGIVLVNWR